VLFYIKKPMQYLTLQQYDEFREELITNLGLDFFEDGEVDYILKEIESYDPRVRQQVLALAHALSHASSSLVPGLLDRIRIASRVLSLPELERWLATAFDIRDSQGIDQALRFLSRIAGKELRSFQADGSLSLQDAAPLLETYVRAISGREFRIIADQEPYTDGVDIFLPAVFSRFPDRYENLGLYKLATANVWAQVRLGTLDLDRDSGFPSSGFPSDDSEQPSSGGARGEDIFSNFSQRQLALDLYTIIESFRIEYFLMKELPGLMKQAAGFKQVLFQERPPLPDLPEKEAFVEGLWQHYLAGKIKGAPGQLKAAVACLFGIQYETMPTESFRALAELYKIAGALPGGYTPRPAPVFVARVRPEKLAQRYRESQALQQKKFEGVVTKLMRLPALEPPRRNAGTRTEPEQGMEPSRDFLLVKGRLIEFDEELRRLIHDQGRMPGSILVKGGEQGGQSPLKLTDLMEEEETDDTAEEGFQYDEWDYRRGAYKKSWCNLLENTIPSGDEPFVQLTLKRYGGVASALRKKFELLRRERRVKRRQKDGDEIDFDALVESFSDMRAGVSPSENVFSRIERQERDIAVLFLLDMSGSTTGWVNEAEKEALVLMSEALETLGDRYAVYGFSSMTRNRCELYRIKGFEEAYDGTVKGRIAEIEPKDYTRMGPFIRHAVELLGKVDARTKLLITLSDSKPEDWDGYKGDYAIEDTRKALIEAGGKGIHPFCITIDREAQSYLPHLFGEVNYIFIDNVRKLPDRITEIYCRLTA
jgi:nitric oxide reductase NorD protein